MKKGQLRIDIPGYPLENAAGKPYRQPTYSTVADASRISIKDQAREYALWLMKNGKERCAVYPIPKSGRGISAEFRAHLVRFHRGFLRFKEVQPEDFLGKLSDKDMENVTCTE